MNRWTGAVVLAAGICWQAAGATIFDNTGTDTGFSFTRGTLEYGNQFTPATGGSAFAITNFAFQYYALHNNSLFGSPFSFRVDVRFYLNDGPVIGGQNEPGTLIFDSGTLNLSGPTGGNIENLNSANNFSFDNHGFYSPIYGGLLVPAGENLTWTVQFSNLASGNSAGTELYDPVVVGQDYSDYWLNNGGTWSLEVNTNGLPNNGGAIMQATLVPEPGTFALAVLGGLGLLASNRRARRK